MKNWKEKVKGFWNKNGNKVIIVGGCIIIAGSIIYLLKSGKSTSFKNFTNADILNHLKKVSNKGAVILPARLNETTLEVLQETLLAAVTNESPEVGIIMKPELAIKVMETVIGREGA